MNSSPSPYLNVTRLQSTQRGMSSTSSCSTLTHSTGPMPSGKSNTSGSENGSVVYQPRSRSQITRRVEALLDRRPDRERRRELVALDHEVGAVAHADLVDLGEQVVGRVAGEDVREARLDADPDEREQARASQPGARELLVAELHPALVRPLRVRSRATSPCRGRCSRRRRRPRRSAGRSAGRPRSGRASAPSRASAATVARRTRRPAPPRSGRRRAGRRAPAAARGSRSANDDPLEEVAPLAIMATAEPTPPVPTTRIFTPAFL